MFVNMISAKYGQILESLKDKEYRDLYVAEHIVQGLAFQIRETREARRWTQGQLGQRTGMAQERVALLENPDYGKFTLTTLKRLASAFDVALSVRFVPFSGLLELTADISLEDLAVPGFDEEIRLLESNAGVLFGGTADSIVGQFTRGPSWENREMQDVGGLFPEYLETQSRTQPVAV